MNKTKVVRKYMQPTQENGKNNKDKMETESRKELDKLLYGNKKYHWSIILITNSL